MKQKFTIYERSIISVFGLLILSLNVMSQTTKQPVAYWPFDEISGAAVRDSSGNGHDGTLKDAESDTALTIHDLWVTGKVGGALEFDDEVYVDVAHFEPYGEDGSFSVAFWMKTDTTSTTGEDNINDWSKGFFMFDKDTWSSPGWGLTNHYSKLVFGCGSLRVIAPTEIDDDIWHHVVLSRDSSGMASIYIDGQESINSGDDKDASTLVNTDNITIGGANQDGRYIGLLDELMFFDYALSSDEISSLATVTSVKVNKMAGFILRQNYPNPLLNGQTEITYTLPKTAHVTIDVYNITGEKVNTLVNEKRQTGTYTVTWDGRDTRNIKLPSGLYFYTMKVGEEGMISKRMILAQ